MYLDEMHEAVQQGDVLELQKLVQKGVDINKPDCRFQFSALHWAAHYGSLECMHWLLWHGVDVHKQTREGWTPSHIAGIRGRSKCLQALAANGADMNVVDAKGKTAAHLAVSHGSSQTLKEILRKGVDTETTDDLGWSLTHTAAYHGQLGCLQVLLKWECKIDVLDPNGNTPVHYAASEGHLTCLKLLISSSSNPEKLIKACNDLGETPKDLAMEHCKSDVINYLDGVVYDLEHPETSDNLAFPAHNSAYRGDLQYLQMIIETGVVSINERDERDSTPAHKAAGNGQIEVLKWLIEKGANVNLMNSYGEIPRDVALRFAQLGCAKILGYDPELEEHDNEDELIPDDPQVKGEARGRAQKKIEELVEQLEIAKLNFQQMGGVLEEDKKKMRETTEHQRVVNDLEKMLEDERIKREKLESQMDKMRLQIHNLNLQLEHAHKRIRDYEVKDHQPPIQQQRKAQKKKTRKTPQPGIFLLQRPISNLTPKPPEDTSTTKRPTSAYRSVSQKNTSDQFRPRTAAVSRYQDISQRNSQNYIPKSRSSDESILSGTNVKITEPMKNGKSVRNETSENGSSRKDSDSNSSERTSSS